MPDRTAPSSPADPRNSPREAVERAGQGSFFGRRKGHRLRQHQTDLMATLLPQLSIDIGNMTPRDPAALFETPIETLRVEIGFGGGEHLVAEATASPHTGFIGCEPYINGMAKVLAQIETSGVRNVRLFAGDAADLLRWLPDNALSRIDLIHPDPWPKRRHWKRRFVQDATIAEMARVIRRGGEFRFVCDIDDYIAWTLAHMMRSPDFTWTAERALDWRAPWTGYTMTRYGRKAEREGRRASYLIFRRT
jgi:tRNA (guanine-N7-)-methyltransferase